MYELDENKQAVIDIFSLNTQKDNYMQIIGDVSEDPITIHIPATDKKLKMKYDAVIKKLEFTGGEDASKKGANLQYRTQYGSYWLNYIEEDGNAADLSIYQQRGATLYFRLKPEAQIANIIPACDKVTRSLAHAGHIRAINLENHIVREYNCNVYP